MGWFSTKEVDAFAQLVVGEVKDRMPPESLGRADRKSAERVHRMTEAISARVRDFAAAQRPNFYKRARLGNAVKWSMLEAGYPEEFVTAFTTELITLVTVAKRGA
jgi:hypothetical protein